MLEAHTTNWNVLADDAIAILPALKWAHIYIYHDRGYLRDVEWVHGLFLFILVLGKM